MGLGLTPNPGWSHLEILQFLLQRPCFQISSCSQHWGLGLDISSVGGKNQLTVGVQNPAPWALSPQHYYDYIVYFSASALFLLGVR